MSTNSTKILLTINLEGGSLIRKTEPILIPWQIKKRDLTSKTIPIEERDIVVDSGKTKHFDLEAKPASLKLNLPYSAYDWFKSPMSVFYPHKVKEWKKLSEEDRINFHLKRLAQHHGSNSFTYIVLEA